MLSAKHLLSHISQTSLGSTTHRQSGPLTLPESQNQQVTGSAKYDLALLNLSRSVTLPNQDRLENPQNRTSTGLRLEKSRRADFGAESGNVHVKA